MPKAQFVCSGPYNAALEKIEDFILAQTGSVDQVGSFLDELDRALEFVIQNPNAAPVHPQTGDQSWPFADGQYRIFFRAVATAEMVKVNLTDIIDNRQANLHIYPGNAMPTYSED